MRIRINNFLILAIFLFANIILISTLVYLAFLTQRNSTVEIRQAVKSAYIPLIDKNIKDLGVTSRAFIIYDPDARIVVKGKNEHFRFSPASSAKIMTTLIVIEEYPLEKVLVAENLANVEGSKMKLEEQESITVENLLYGLMLPSANDAAYVLAENYEGGIEQFIRRMNEKAKELKLGNTEFFDPSGFSDANYTTAFDLARLASYAIGNEKFKQIVSTKEKTVYDVSGQIAHKLSNLNELLGVYGVSGIKTGFTEEAGGVFVASINYEGKTYVIVVLSSQDRFGDTKNIILNALKYINLISY